MLLTNREYYKSWIWKREGGLKGLGKDGILDLDIGEVGLEEWSEDSRVLMQILDEFGMLWWNFVGVCWFVGKYFCKSFYCIFDSDLRIYLVKMRYINVWLNYVKALT